MKYSLACLFILIIASSAGFAQSKWYIGAEAGPTLRTIFGSGVPDDAKPTIGVLAGFNVKYGVNEKLFIRSGVNFQRKGFSFPIVYRNENGQEIGSSIQRINFEYFDLPLLVQFETGEKHKFLINGGPYLGWLAQQFFIDEGGFISDERIKNTDNYRRLNLGFTLGIGGLFSITERVSVSAELSDSFTLLNIAEFTDKGYRHSDLSLSVGVIVGIGSKE